MHITLNNILCSSLDDVKRAASAEVSAFVAEYLNPSDYVIAHTSGSTGDPKEIHLSKADMRASARLTTSFSGSTPTRCSTSTCRLATSQVK